jgi:trimeric autotransporter adhesin
MGGISCQRIARWNGSTWNTVGGGVTGSMPQVYTMCVYDGWLYVGGSFQMAGGVPVNQIAKWNGLQWDSVGPGVNGYSPLSMIVDTLHNNLIISGNFACANPAFGNCICAWNGVNYLPFGQGLQFGARVLAFYKNYLFTTKPSVSGAFTDTTILYWDSTSWRPISGPNNDINTLIGYNNELYVGGPFTQIDSMSIPYIARFSFPSIGIKELKFKISSLMIYPNPSEGSVNLTYYFNNPTKEIILRIFDISGKIVVIKKFSRPTGNYCIGHGMLPSGLYIATIQNNIEKLTQKFIIE